MFRFKLVGLILNGLVDIIMVKCGLEVFFLVGFSSMWYAIAWLLWLGLVWFGFGLVIVYVKLGVVFVLFDL